VLPCTIHSIVWELKSQHRPTILKSYYSYRQLLDYLLIVCRIRTEAVSTKCESTLRSSAIRVSVVASCACGAVVRYLTAPLSSPIVCRKSACCFATVAWDKGTPAILSPFLFLFGIYLQSLIVGCCVFDCR